MGAGRDCFFYEGLQSITPGTFFTNYVATDAVLAHLYGQFFENILGI